jgi:hypothetical protein
MLTRRDFMAELAVGVAAIGAGSIAPPNAFAAMPRSRVAVVSIHMDQPYMDATGRELPYLPPHGVRGGMPVAHLGETEFRRHFVYL